MYEEQAQKLVDAYHTENAQFAYDPLWHQQENWQEKYPQGWGLTRKGWDRKNLKPSDLAAGQAILEADPQVQVAVIIAVLSHSSWEDTTNYHATMNNSGGFHALLSQLYKRTLPYTSDNVQRLVQFLITREWGNQALLRALSRPLLLDPQKLALCRKDLEQLRVSTPLGPFLKLLNEILETQQERPIILYPDDWGALVAPSLAEMESDLREHWFTLLRHCTETKGSVPSDKWLAHVPQLREALGQENFLALATIWIGAFGRNKGARLHEENANLLRGLAWCCVDGEDTRLATTLADAAIEGYRKISGLGPRSPRIASACVYALKCMNSLHGAAQLERVRLKVKQPGYGKEIELALNVAAQRAGMTRDDLIELTVPTFDLEEGCLRLAIGPASAKLWIVGSKVQIQWYDGAGNPRQTEPPEVKRDYKTEVKDLKRLSNDLATMLSAQRDRLERLLLAERSWSLVDWRERYLDHPLVGCIAQRLIWHFVDGERTVDGIWSGSHLVDANNRQLELSEATSVSPWHPVFCDADEVLRWRNWLDLHRVQQPFKQAYREIYLLTDAERNTRVYSNRFAAHILRQHQFHALAIARGWRNQLRLMVDDSYTPAMLDLLHWGLRAEFWIEGAGDQYGVDTNNNGTFLSIATDQVRFYRIGAAMNMASAAASGSASGGGYSSSYDQRLDPNLINEPLPLEQIPPLVFSEVMRDVDLFVGVASIGNDPTWYDGAHQYDDTRRNRYHDYWYSYSFGTLSTTAEMRKHILERLLPQLIIADRCFLEERFLIVRGDLHTYKIHLGSGNILMEPNDQYLCIVPNQKSGEPANEEVFLPFEGDTILSIILSKAFLLAEDAKITDSLITNQIRR